MENTKKFVVISAAIALITLLGVITFVKFAPAPSCDRLEIGLRKFCEDCEAIEREKGLRAIIHCTARTVAAEVGIKGAAKVCFQLEERPPDQKICMAFAFLDANQKDAALAMCHAIELQGEREHCVAEIERLSAKAS